MNHRHCLCDPNTNDGKRIIIRNYRSSSSIIEKGYSTDESDDSSTKEPLNTIERSSKEDYLSYLKRWKDLFVTSLGIIVIGLFISPVNAAEKPFSLIEFIELPKVDTNASLEHSKAVLEISKDYAQRKYQQTSQEAQRLSQDLKEYQRAEAQRKADKLAEYDALFDEDETVRNKYYGQMALEKTKKDEIDLDKEKKNTSKVFNVLAELKVELQMAQDKEDTLKAAIAQTNQPELKIDLEKSIKERQLLQRKVDLEASLVEIRSTRQEVLDLYEQRSIDNEAARKAALEKFQLIKEEEKREYEILRARKQVEKEELQFQQEQLEFERRLKFLDKSIE